MSIHIGKNSYNLRVYNLDVPQIATRILYSRVYSILSYSLFSTRTSIRVCGSIKCLNCMNNSLIRVFVAYDRRHGAQSLRHEELLRYCSLSHSIGLLPCGRFKSEDLPHDASVPSTIVSRCPGRALNAEYAHRSINARVTST